MKIGLVGPSYEQRSLPFDAQRSINLFPVFDEQGKEVASLYSVPGKSLFCTAGVGPGRECFSSSNGRAFVVSGTELYEITSVGTSSLLGILEQSSGIVSMAENGTQLAICDGASLYILTYETNVFAKVVDPDLPSVGTVTYSDGYFVVTENESGRFYVSSLKDGTGWAALDFATAESSPDKLRRSLSSIGQLWLYGDRTTEVWTNTGDSVFPFRRMSGAVLEVGISSPYTAVAVDNGCLFVGQDKYGTGIVYKASGLTPMRISTNTIEKRIQEASNPLEIRAWCYQQEGCVFYVLTGGGLQTSLVYDLTTQLWHERAHLSDSGEFEQDIAESGMFAFGKTLVIDRRNGDIYELSLDFFDDAGGDLVRERVYTHISDEGKRIRYNSLEIGFETGVGLQSGNGSSPLVSLQLSTDGARTYTDWVTASIGAAGQYGQKVEFRRIGVAESMTFKIRISDRVKVAITGSYLR